ncbi:MAG TPA: hypothetical protein VN851_11860 [Thermoanaerobaculia bacterium]|nr:hypothetical protein [Thermoanaerobaculia bacterium]
MRRALGGEEAPGDSAPRPSALRWLMVWLLLAAVYFVVRLAVRWLLSDAGSGEGAAGFALLQNFRGLDGRELAIVPAAQTLALVLLAELRRAVKEKPV